MTHAVSRHASNVVIEEPDLATVSAADVGAWIAYGDLMDEESADVAYELPRIAVKAVGGDRRVRVFIARDPDGAIVADGRAFTISDDADLEQLCQVKVSVRADRRGRGIGLALLELVVEAAEAAHRPTLVGWTSSHVPAGERFARRIGASPALGHHVNRLRRSEIDWATVGEWIARGAERAADYQLIAIAGAYPDELLEPLAELHQLLESVPLGGAALRPMRVRPDDFRAREQNRSGTEHWTLCARYVPSGELAGFTSVCVTPEQPTVLRQLNTAIRPSHRRRGLCTWMKATMLERLMREKPSLEEVRTSNFASNDPILGVNRAFGFTPFVTETMWVAPTAGVREWLARSGQP